MAWLVTALQALALMSASSAAAAAAAPCTMSNVFGDHMVLQRAPANPMVFGFAAPNTTVRTHSFGGLSAAADAAGVWRIVLPAQPASKSTQGATVAFSCSTGESFSLKDVLFGEVHICSGQSNMQFTLASIGQQLGFDAKAEIAEANNYGQIRTMTVGQKLASIVPLRELGAAPQLPWSVASNESIGQGNWTATSAVCWFYARNLFQATKVPQGIISSNWGGTIIQSWSDNATNAKCAATTLTDSADPSDNQLPVGVDGPEKFAATPLGSNQPNPNAGHGVLFNAMIYPFAVGPMSVNTFIWFQVCVSTIDLISPSLLFSFALPDSVCIIFILVSSLPTAVLVLSNCILHVLPFLLCSATKGESNIRSGAKYYGCAQTAMIEMWREYFKHPTAFFGFVELEPWCQRNGANCVGPESTQTKPILADFRAGQLSSLDLPHVGFAIATDIGDPTGPFSSIHPRNKKVVGKRLAAAALTIAYGIPTVYLPPTYTSAAAVVADAGFGIVDIAVTVQFDNVPTTLVPADDHCKTEHPYNVSANQCAWFSISVTTGAGAGMQVVDLNASAAVGADGRSLVLSATATSTSAARVGGADGTAGKIATAFGWGAWPINTIVSAEGLPLQPWTAEAPNVTAFATPTRL